jgi:outer membrane immunogenic protein
MSLAAIVALTGAPALAAGAPLRAPPPPAPAASWTGWYLGVEGGGALGQSQTVYADPRSAPFVGMPMTNPFALSGGLFGGAVGYIRQFNNFVVGAEGDLSLVSESGDSNDIAPFNTSVINTTSEKWLGTARLRLGMTTANAWLVYATGGFAAGGVEDTINASAGGSGVHSQTKTLTGWTIGAGVEAALSRNWSVKAEYLYVDLQKGTYFSPDLIVPNAIIGTRTVNLNNNIVRAGLNYRFE